MAKKKSAKSGKKLIKSVIAAAAVFAVCVLCLVGVCIEKGVFSDELFQKKIELPDLTPSKVEPDDNFDFGVYFFDVGQGDSELIVSGSTAVLIDAGEAEYGKTVVKNIKALGIEKLDYIIATHPHADHIGGLAEVIEGFEVGKIIAPRVSDELTPTTAVYESFLDTVRAKGMKLTAAKAGNTYSLDGAELEILAPLSDDYDDLNDFSVVCRVTKGDISFLFTGDASKASEADMTASGEELYADVLKVGHHGSKTASTNAFLEEVTPSVCVISCGKDNDYGHPAQAALSRLEKHTENIYRTDLNGNIAIFTEGEKLYIKTDN
ncbi:MAG: ComEC/Rec2 family competence protein [Oscillospiraceae bacterium]